MRPRIEINAGVHSGKPCVAGTRIPVRNVLELVRELLNHDRERARDFVEHVVAEREVRLLRELLRLVRHHLHPHERDEVARMLQEER